MGFNRGHTYRERVDRPVGTLLDHLAQVHRHSSRAQWEERIADGEVWLRDRPGRAGDRVCRGDEIRWNRPPWEEPWVPRSWALLHRDDDVLVVAKPRGLPTLPSGGFLENTLLALVRRCDPGATPMHRLGRGTSGLVVFGRTRRARSALARSWRDGAVQRIYRGLVEGRPERERFHVDTPIGLVPHPRLGTVYGAVAVPDGRAARTDVRVLAPGRPGSIVEVEIETGRPDQIRIHLACAGHPLLGDPLFGPGGRPRSDALPGEGGYRLHAAQIVFPHPASGRRILVECAPPACLR